MNLASILEQITADRTSHKVQIPPTWHQGRTAYGGLSAALTYQAAKLIETDLPPLQSAQIAFAGPLAGEVEITAETLRRGRNTAFIKSEIASGTNDARETGLSCSFIFMKRRESHVAYEGLQPPEFPPIPDAASIRSGPAEFFTGHLQYPGNRLELGLATNCLANWHRITERERLDPIAELICIADALPPSVMGMMSEKGMVSSMNWQVNMLTDMPATKDGWWFLTSETHHAGRGASSQYMTVWNADGEAVMTAMQSVAIFV